MKKYARDVRRHHRERLLKKRKKYWAGSASDSAKKLGVCVKTPCVCSCFLCGNKRKFWGPTIQELKNSQSDKKK